MQIFVCLQSEFASRAVSTYFPGKPTIITMDDNLTKANSIHHVDDASAKSVHDAVTTPESLRHMTEEEIQRMDTKMVRKLDFVIL